MLVDRLDQKEREEYYETPKIHGVSTNDIRFLEADKLVNYTLVILYSATALAATYALCTLGLLIGIIGIFVKAFIIRTTIINYPLLSMLIAGVVKRRCELIVPWVIFQSMVCGLFAITLFVAYAFPNEFFLRHMGTIYYCRCKY